VTSLATQDSSISSLTIECLVILSFAWVAKRLLTFAVWGMEVNIHEVLDLLHDYSISRQWVSLCRLQWKRQMGILLVLGMGMSVFEDGE
jgi:hypothetical protein